VQKQAHALHRHRPLLVVDGDVEIVDEHLIGVEGRLAEQRIEGIGETLFLLFLLLVLARLSGED